MRILLHTNQSRMKKVILLSITSLLISNLACTQSTKEHKLIPNCEDCELLFEGMPENASWQTVLSAPDEEGEPMTIRGVIYKRDGKTPAPDVILYVYQTDASGRYSPAPKQTQGKRHGHLRGWMKTDKQGRYQFTSIRPASYPNSRNPQHVHAIIMESPSTVYWIDDFLFDDDPLLSSTERTRQQNRGGSGILSLKKNEKNVWIGSRDLVLHKNVTD